MSYHSSASRSRSQFLWWLDRDSIGIALYSPTSTTAWTSPSTDYSGRKIVITSVKKGTHLTLPSAGALFKMSQTTDVPEQFDEYLVYKVIAMGYEKKPDTIQIAQYFDQKYAIGVGEGKKYANKGRLGSSRRIAPVDF